MSNPIKIVMVSYLNSKPFEYGLQELCNTDTIELITAIPADCAKLFRSGGADVALLPVGALVEMQDYKIISDFGISCDGEVRTVCIFSNQDLRKCKKLYLDSHSRSSVLLSKVIIEQYLNLDIQYAKIEIGKIELEEDEAILMIGDKVFEHEREYSHRYDLGTMWKEWTGLPFVFAVWVSRTDLPDSFVAVLNKAFQKGIANISEVILKESKGSLDLNYYFTHNIQYQLDENKKAAMRLYLEKVSLLRENVALTII